MTFDVTYTVFNSLEAIFWIILGIVLLFQVSHAPKGLERSARWGGVVFIIFGISDVVEIAIGGIFEPHQYWLLAIKVSCVAAFVVLFINYLKIRTKR